MNALAETYDGLSIGNMGARAPRSPGFLRRIAARLAAADRTAARRFPDEDEIRLSLHALGRGFDCM